MKRALMGLLLLVASPALSQQPVPSINFDSVPNPLKLPHNMYFGEVSGKRASDDPYGSRIERELAGLAANAIGAEKPSCVFRLQFVSRDFAFESSTATIVT